MSEFKGRHFDGEIVLWAVRWSCRYGVSYCDLEQMMGARGVSVDYSTIYRWVQKCAPALKKRLRWQRRGALSTSWRVAFNITTDIRGVARIVGRAFGLGAFALAEAVHFIKSHLKREAA